MKYGASPEFSIDALFPLLVCALSLSTTMVLNLVKCSSVSVEVGRMWIFFSMLQMGSLSSYDERTFGY